MTHDTDVFRAQTQKCVTDFITDLRRSMTMSGFIIHNEDKMEMVRHFGYHGVDLSGDFDLNSGASLRTKAFSFISADRP